MKILHISDTHGNHEKLKLQKSDVICHTGDSTNYHNPIFNEEEFYTFVDWYKKVDCNYKIYIAGNHDSFISENKKIAESYLQDSGIIYLNKEEVTIRGIKFYGDPTSPNFKDWYFMANRGNMRKHWKLIPRDVNVLLTHVPPKGILDLSTDENGYLEMCGCSSLNGEIEALKSLKASLFGHIHSNKQFNNHGILIRDEIYYSNGAAIRDGKMGVVCNNGNLIEI